MSDVVLSQLVEAESQLAAQVLELTTQLEAIQEKRKGVKTVIGMFHSPDGASESIGGGLISMASVGGGDATPKPGKRSPGPKAKPAKVAPKTTKKSASTSKVTSTAAKKKAPKTASSRQAKSGKAPNWVRYVQDPFRKTPLPDVVANILKAQPDDIFKIVDVMESVFKPNMPKAAFLKARNRVSNILSAGARSKEWYRGRAGRYSLSKKVLKI